jgi:3-hydroxy-3-methylglutaryl CoA synthase
VEQAYAALLDGDGCDVSADEVRRGFLARVDPGLLHNRQVANLYSGSVFASLIALAENMDHLHGRRVGIYSYGSGACAELYSGELVPGAAAVVGRHGIGARLAARRPVSVADYEEAVRASAESLVGPRYEPVVGPEIADLYRTDDLLVLKRVDNHHRIYAPSASAGAAVQRGRDGVG